MSYRNIVGIVLVLVGVVVVANVVLPNLTKATYQSAASTQSIAEKKPVVQDVPTKKIVEDAKPIRTHVPLPQPLKAIYMTSCVVGTPTFRDSVVSIIDTTEINALVIDIKDFSGTLSFAPTASELMPAWTGTRCGTKDMESFIQTLHKKGIYVIGRITVFQDPFYTKNHPELAVKRTNGTVWKDYKKLSFIDVGAKPYWDYIVLLGVDSYNIGFDELNFDYVRYPSDGNLSDVAFTHSGGKDKQENLESFFKYLHESLADASRYSAVQHENTGRDESGPYLSVDLFGMTTSAENDLSIGQVEERAAPYFDFIAPMVYPSHYPHGFIGLGNPNKYPYEVVHYALTEGVRRLVATTTPMDGFAHTRIGTSTPALYEKPVYDKDKLRPWLQDFDYGGTYGVPEIRAQIKAAYDAGLSSWMIWDPANHYTRGAYLPE